MTCTARTEILIQGRRQWITCGFFAGHHGDHGLAELRWKDNPKGPPDLSKLKKWQLVPPHAVNFKNEWASSVHIEFPAGREMEVAESLQQQIAYHLYWHQQQEAQRAVIASVKEAAEKGLTLGVDPATGNIVKK